MSSVTNNLQIVQAQIFQYAQQCERDPNLIKLVAVSKTKPVSMITEAIAAGQYAFAENYVQEGCEKIAYFKQQAVADKLIWHFIGPLQSNKCKLVAQHFDWVHTIDRLKIIQRLHDNRLPEQTPLNVLLQINISQEASKSGIEPSQMLDLASQIQQYSRLRLRGLMAIPAPQTDPSSQLTTFQQMRQLFEQLQQHYPEVDTLSMGMSDDMAAAIAAGTTLVRIGSAIFGARQPT